MKKHFFGRLVSALSASALAVSGMGVLPTAEVSAAALSGQDAKGIVSKMTIGWNLGNTLDSYNDSLGYNNSPGKFAKAWGNPEPTADQFQAIKDGGFNTVRIPTTWYQHIQWDESSKMYLINDTWMDYVKTTVDYAIDRDMFVILNVHHEDWVNVDVFTDETYKVAEKKLTDIWTQVSETFKDYDQHLIFEGMNEPRQLKNPNVSQWGDGSGDGGYTYKYINDLNAAFVKTVRGNGSAANKERLLMLPGYCASSTPATIRQIAIPDNAGNVALSVHAYAPYYFTMATDDKANHSFPGKSGWGEDYEGALSSMFSEFGKIQQEKNVPIIIGEFSASDFDNTEDRCRWATSYLSKAKEQGIPCVLWDNNVVGRDDGEAHGYLYRDTCTWYPKSKTVIETMMQVYGISPKLPDYQEATKPTFDWANMTIGSNWVELFRSEEGKDLKVWGNTPVDKWKDYASDAYEFVLFYKSDADPELVLQGDNKIWDRVTSSDETETMFVKKFTFDDIKASLANYKNTLDEMTTLYISATSKALTAYGLYAVPTGAVTTESTEPSSETQPTTEETKPSSETQPTTEPTEPSSETQPTTEPTKPSSETQPATEPTTEPSTQWDTGGAHYIVHINVRDVVNNSLVKDAAIVIGDGEEIAMPNGDYYLNTPTSQAGVVVKLVKLPEGFTAQETQITLQGDAMQEITFYATPPVVPTETLPSEPDLIKFGDVNEDGEVDILDVIAINKAVLGTAKLSNKASVQADVDESGKVDSQDALWLLKYVVEMIDTLPVPKT